MKNMKIAVALVLLSAAVSRADDVLVERDVPDWLSESAERMGETVLWNPTPEVADGRMVIADEEDDLTEITPLNAQPESASTRTEIVLNYTLDGVANAMDLPPQGKAACCFVATGDEFALACLGADGWVTQRVDGVELVLGRDYSVKIVIDCLSDPATVAYSIRPADEQEYSNVFSGPLRAEACAVPRVGGLELAGEGRALELTGAYWCTMPPIPPSAKIAGGEAVYGCDWTNATLTVRLSKLDIGTSTVGFAARVRRGDETYEGVIDQDAMTAVFDGIPVSRYEEGVWTAEILVGEEVIASAEVPYRVTDDLLAFAQDTEGLTTLDGTYKGDYAGYWTRGKSQDGRLVVDIPTGDEYPTIFEPYFMGGEYLNDDDYCLKGGIVELDMTVAFAAARPVAYPLTKEVVGVQLASGGGFLVIGDPETGWTEVSAEGLTAVAGTDYAIRAVMDQRRFVKSYWVREAAGQGPFLPLADADGRTEFVLKLDQYGLSGLMKFSGDGEVAGFSCRHSIAFDVFDEYNWKPVEGSLSELFARDDLDLVCRYDRTLRLVHDSTIPPTGRVESQYDSQYVNPIWLATVGDPEDTYGQRRFVTLDQAMANAATNPHPVTVLAPVTTPTTVTLRPGMKVSFRPDQVFGAGGVTLAKPSDFDDSVFRTPVPDKDGNVSLEVDEEAIRTSFEDEDGKPAFAVDPATGRATFNIENLKRGVWWGLATSDTLEGLLTAEPSEWHRVEENGSATGEAAASSASGFYKVMTTVEEPR